VSAAPLEDAFKATGRAVEERVPERMRPALDDHASVHAGTPIKIMTARVTTTLFSSFAKAPL